MLYKKTKAKTATDPQIKIFVIFNIDCFFEHFFCILTLIKIPQYF